MNEPASKQSEEFGGSTSNGPAPKSNLYQALRLVGFTSGYIFGPMILFGAFGWWLSERFNSLIFLFASLIIALIISNVLIFKNTGRTMKRIQNK